MIFRLWSRVGVAPRIGLVMILTFAATQLYEKALRVLVPPPGFLFVDRAWFLNAAVEARRVAAAAKADERAAALSLLPSSQWLQYEIAEKPPERPTNTLPESVVSLRTELVGRLAIEPGQVVMRAASFSAPLSTINPGVAVFSGLPARVSEMSPKKFLTDVLIVSGLTIGIQMADQSWLVVRQQDDLIHERVLRNVALFIGGLLLIGGLSLWLAHSLVKPLTQLTTAAEKLGREREPTPIGDMSIPEYATIARAFNEMQSRLKNFVDERTQMLAAISHDLRTPLTRLRLFAEYVQDQKQRRQILSDISEMEAMIDSSLTFASEEVKREPHSAVDIASLLISICDNFADLGGRIDYEGPNHAALSCQPVAMRRALSNLIDNGQRYGERVVVTLGEEAQAIVICIRDCGPGIPPEQVERAFAPFQRLDNSRNRETGGTGLGLTIARDVIRGHGGDITLLPAEPTGLLVLVRLPKPLRLPKSKCDAA